MGTSVFQENGEHIMVQIIHTVKIKCFNLFFCSRLRTTRTKSELAALYLQMDLINIQNSCSVNRLVAFAEQTERGFNNTTF